MDKQLYLIALIPPKQIGDRVHALKEEMKARFNAKHALKAPPHITLQMPFRLDDEGELNTIKQLNRFASEQKPFSIVLNGFDAFEPRVIFVKIENQRPIKELHLRLKRVLIEDLSFPQKKVINELHPHMTIATRDLTESNFYTAWSEFKSRPFEGNFRADSISLLNHNGKNWDIYKSFPFSEEEE
ncbi:MAG: 2'-5' RNA ligase family protein [Balneolaceae bacterium]|nr:MAG: 2'-5' RNA ligase family protein [Balneolaceae bacterium]